MYLRSGRCRKAGFSLLEVAVVLFISGAVFAAIFTTVSLSMHKTLVNQAVDEIGVTANNIRGYYTGVPIPTLTACPVDFTATPTLISTQVFPKEMIGGGVVNNPFNPNATTATALAALCKGTNVTEFVVRYTTLPKDGCTDLILRNSLPGSDTGLVGIYVNATSVGILGNTTKPLPVSPVDASTACSSASNSIDWYYLMNN